MEQNKEMTASESLALITKTRNESRKDIVQRSGKYLLLWGILLTVFSLLVFSLWTATGKPDWNLLWFVMPIIGVIVSSILKRKEPVSLPDNAISRMIGVIWRCFGVFAVSTAIFTLLFAKFGHTLGAVAVAIGLTPTILLLFGMAETVSGIAVKNKAITVAGFLTGIGGLVLYYLTASNCDGAEEILLFTLAGVVLAVTGLIVKHQNK